jgi:glycosyltransferase involved in cell wall biosynthesis
VTSGQLELEGGGWHAENRVLIALGWHSRIVERSVLRMLREFDLVVVRGNQARSYIEQAGYENDLITITASVGIPGTRSSFDDRSFDIVFVGRLTEYKRPDRLLSVLTELSKLRPDFRAAVLGDGPDAAELKSEAGRRGLTENILWNGKTENVGEFLAMSRIYLLTSRWEGVSIAMLEAMGAGCVPVVSDVGDLRDFVISDMTGYILPENEIDQFAKRIHDVLGDSVVWDRMSSRCNSEIEARASMTAIAECWRQALTATLGEKVEPGDSSTCAK